MPAKKLQGTNRFYYLDILKMSAMKKTMLLLLFLTLASAGCGSQEIVEPNRDDFVSGEVKTMIGPMGQESSDDGDSE